MGGNIFKRSYFKRFTLNWHLALNTPEWYKLQCQLMTCTLKYEHFLSIIKGHPPSYCKFLFAQESYCTFSLGNHKTLHVHQRLCLLQALRNTETSSGTKETCHRGTFPHWFPGGLASGSSSAIRNVKLLKKEKEQMAIFLQLTSWLCNLCSWDKDNQKLRCVYMHVYHVHMYAYMYAHVCMKARGWCPDIFLNCFFIFFFWGGISYWTWSLLVG